MKYKDFKMMSMDEMKNIKGGTVPATGCIANCETTWSSGSNYKYTVSGLESCEPEGNLCYPSDKFISCGCMTVNFPGNNY